MEVEGFHSVYQDVRLAAGQQRVEGVRLRLTPLSERVTVAATKTERDRHNRGVSNIWGSAPFIGLHRLLPGRWPGGDKCSLSWRLAPK